MADGRVEAPAPSAPQGSSWAHIFRSFQVALDPRKLLVAAAGILVMSFGWYVLSTIFHYDRPVRGAEEYSNAVLDKEVPAKDGADPAAREALLKEEGDRRFNRDLKRWRVIDELAGKAVDPTNREIDPVTGLPDEYRYGKPIGRMRAMPWDEFRGPNPYLFASQLASQPPSTWGEAVLKYLLQQTPVLIEPLTKILLPVIKIVDGNAGPGTRLYLILCLLWSVIIWAFCGGVITRLAAVQFAGKERTTLAQAVKFVGSRYGSYVLSPVVPLGVVALILLAMFLYGLVALIPFVGDILLYGLLFPLVILGGIAMAVILLGLVGYPLMYTTISTEGSDTFDAISRSYNYVFQAPWSFVWYSFVSLVYGAAVTFVVILIGCLMVLLGKFGMSAAAATVWSPSKPDYLFVYAPESYGWREMLLRGSDMEVARPDLAPGRPVAPYAAVNPTLSDAYYKSLSGLNKAGAGIVAFWLAIVFLFMIGFSYSYFWSAYTMVYLLMRKKVDEVEIDEVYIEEDLPPVTPTPTPAPTTPAGGASLPVVPPPVAPVSPPPPVTTVPPPPEYTPRPTPSPPPPVVTDAEPKVPPTDTPKM